MTKKQKKAKRASSSSIPADVVYDACPLGAIQSIMEYIKLLLSLGIDAIPAVRLNVPHDIVLESCRGDLRRSSKEPNIVSIMG